MDTNEVPKTEDAAIARWIKEQDLWLDNRRRRPKTATRTCYRLTDAEVEALTEEEVDKLCDTQVVPAGRDHRWYVPVALFPEFVGRYPQRTVEVLA